MTDLTIHITTHAGVSGEFPFQNFAPAVLTKNGIHVELHAGSPAKVSLTPPAGDRIARITYRLSVPLRNFHQVVVPDTGRLYSRETQLVDFWGRTFASRINNIRMPVFILTGQDHNAALVFGVIGQNFETDFTVCEPALKRALMAWMKRFSIEIQRGTSEYPIPDSVARAYSDGMITEHLYFRDAAGLAGRNWHAALRDFSSAMASILGKTPRSNRESLAPYWCSWTDWDSSQVTADVILRNVVEGRKLGIDNYIIDDGWFGLGLDSDASLELDIGDWTEDPAKIPDLRALVRRMHEEGGRAIIWCAPHAVGPRAKCFGERRHLFMQTKKGVPVTTSNGYHPLCFRSPEARRVMAGICASFITRYYVDGGKYDLFNNIPSEPCVSDEHSHDTGSTIEGLDRTLAQIDAGTRRLKPGFITELKQNYGTPWLYEYGTGVRAGDTPYNPEGNFLRTAYIAAYTPYSINDYQTLTNNDSDVDAARIILKMIAVGVPTWSMDLSALDVRHRDAVRFYHEWYLNNLDALSGPRIPLDAALSCWHARGRDRDIYVLVNDGDSVEVGECRACEIANGGIHGAIRVGLPRKSTVVVDQHSPHRGSVGAARHEAVEELTLACGVGGIVRMAFVQGGRCRGVSRNAPTVANRPNTESIPLPRR